MKLNKSYCDEIKNSNCIETQTVTKLRNSKCDKIPNVTKLKNSNCDKNLKLKL